MPRRDDGSSEERLKRAAKAVTHRVEVHGEQFPMVRDRCQAALLHDGFLSEPAAREAAFHMADWIGDLVEFNEMLVDEKFDPERAQEVLRSFLIHVPNHLVAAARIVMDKPVEDIFELGAVKGTGRAKRKPGERYPDEPWGKPKRDG